MSKKHRSPRTRQTASTPDYIPDPDPSQLPQDTSRYTKDKQSPSGAFHATVPHMVTSKSGLPAMFDRRDEFNFTIVELQQLKQFAEQNGYPAVLIPANTSPEDIIPSDTEDGSQDDDGTDGGNIITDPSSPRGDSIESDDGGTDGGGTQNGDNNGGNDTQNGDNNGGDDTEPKIAGFDRNKVLIGGGVLATALVIGMSGGDGGVVRGPRRRGGGNNE